MSKHNETIKKVNELEELIKANQYRLKLNHNFSYYEELIADIVNNIEEFDNNEYFLKEELRSAEREIEYHKERSYRKAKAY